MPLVHRHIEPVRINRTRVDTKDQFDLSIVSNNALTAVMRQMSSLVQHAEDMFNGLSEEYRTVLYRTERLQSKVTVLTSNVGKLDAKTVIVPESDLENYANFVDHLRTDYGYDSGCFTPATRPRFIRELYAAAVPTPVKVIRTCNILRTDGKTGSKIFSVPLVLEDEQDVPPILEEPKVPQGAPSPRSQKSLKEPRPHSVPVVSDLDAGPLLDSSTLPSPRRRLQDISRSQPVTLVPINTTGSGFQRLCDYRESIRSSSREYLDEEGTAGRRSTRRKKGSSSRRLTVTGVPGHVADELRDSGFFQVTQPSAEIHSRSASRDRWERPRSCMGMHDQFSPRASMHCDSDDGELARSCSLRRSLRSLFKDRRAKSQDLWVTGSPRPPGPPVVDLRMGRLMRSTSLPRSLKSVVKESFGKLSFERSSSTEGRLDSRTDDLPSSTSFSSNSGQPPPPKRSAIKKIKDKLKLTKSSKNKSHDKLPRSQSHHADLHSPATTSRILDPGGGSMRRPKSMELRPRPRMSRSQSTLESIRVKTPVTPVEKSEGGAGLTSGGRHVHVNIPSQPWTKPFADVKLRGNGQAVKEDGNSSSGHWSASSGRQSFDSEVPRSSTSSSKLPPSGSENSVDRDSAVCLLRETPRKASSDVVAVVHAEEIADDDASTIVGDGDLDDVDEPSTPVVGKRQLSIDDDMPSSSSRSSSEERSSSKHVRGLTLENLLQHELKHSGHSKVRRPYLCDDESSVYSVDQDGFFTSMHQDSGLKRGIMDMDTSSIDNFSQSSSTSSKAKRGSSSFLAMLPGSLRRKKNAKKAPPPPPPPRNSHTTLRKSNLKLDVDCLTPQSSPSVELQRLVAVANKVAAQEERRARLGLDLESSHPIDLPPPGSSQDSDTDSLIQMRVRKKSFISSNAYPSLVSVTPSNSEEEDLDFLDFKSAWRNKEVPGISSTNSLKSCKSAPGELLPNGRPRSFSQVSCNGTMECIEENTHESSMDDSFILNDSSRDSSGFSTWPRSPSQKEMKKQKKSKDPKALPKASTPQKGCERTALSSVNSFNENPQASTGAPVTPQSSKVDILTMVSMPSKSHYANSKIISTVAGVNRAPVSLQVASSTPVPASARLIITSPVSNKAAFVENPHKRSVCSAVTDEDFQKFSNYSSPDKWCNELPCSTPASRESTPPKEPEPKINKPLLKSSTAYDFTQEKLDSVLRDSTQLSNPLYPTMKSMKHSVSFSSSVPEKKVPDAYGKSWYEGIRPTAEPKETVVEVHAPPNKTPARVSFTSFMKNPTDPTVPSTGLGLRRGSNASTISSGSSGSAGKRQVFATIHRQPTTPVAHSVLEAESKPVMPPDVTERLREFTPEKPETKIEFPTFPRASGDRKISSQSHKGYSQNRHRHSVVSNDSTSTSISAPGDFMSPSSVKAATERKSSTLERLKAPVKTEATPKKTKSAFEKIKSTRKKLNESTESEDTHIGSDHELDIPTPMPLLTNFSSMGPSLFKPPSDPTSICSANPQTPLSHESKSATLPHRRKLPDTLPVKKGKGDTASKVTTKPTPLKFVWPPVTKASAPQSSQSPSDSKDSSPVVQRQKERSRSVTSLEGLPLSAAKTELTQSTTNLNKMNGLPVENGLSNGRSYSNLSYASNLSLYRSSVSLAGSNDSLASNASISAERTRVSKMAFLGSTSSLHETVKDSVDDRFSKHSLGQKSLSRSRSSLSCSRGNLSSISETKTVDIQIEPSGSRSPSSYVTSLVGQFQRKSSPTSSVSSGVGSSLTSPCSPPPSPAKPIVNNNNILKNSDYRAMIGSKTPYTKRDSTIIDSKQRDH